MTIAMQPIYTQTVGAGGAASITFNNIPQTFTDLMVLTSLRASSGNAVSSYIASINGGSYLGSQRMINGDGTTAYSSSNLPYFTGGSGYTANTFSSSQFYVPNYRSSNFKQFLIDFAPENNASATALGMTAALIRVTDPISSIGFSCDNSFVQYSTVTLYGITKG